VARHKFKKKYNFSYNHKCKKKIENTGVYKNYKYIIRTFNSMIINIFEMKMNDISLYFIAVIPSEPLLGLVDELKLEFSNSYHSHHALKSPPHITIIPPFTMNKKDEKNMAENLKNFTSQSDEFEVSISGFGRFKSRVIYLRILTNNILESLQNLLAEKCNTELDIPIKSSKPYRPHMTLAFRDLSPQMFNKAWEKYKHKTFNASFAVDRLFLLRHNGKNWDIANEIPFGRSMLPS
jgi:2'-5' RNA ligase